MILFTAALVVVVGFWLLVALGVTTADTFDADADLDGLGMGGVPVAVAMSLLTALAWILGLGATAVLTALSLTGTVTGILRLVVPVAGLLVAWWLTRSSVRRLRRFSSDERRSGHDAAGI
ncbi:hypothetical protein [Streptomyces cylindrosporus]|uniref:Uncharacterized protein n=1 Tax=Streptomyces cylindrosporus TaxID=2927583 RepID=A0ABS9YLG9_9ACTN|nr:hypothetical protein [Streptomyces cylindrosporus]MCI3276691.1 hypothetical protein [Streptomyces cylindrosporus]